MWWSEWWNSYPDLLRLWSLFPFTHGDVLITGSVRASLPGNRLLSTCRLCYRGNRMTAGKSGTQSCVPANSDQLTSGVNIMRSNRLETSSALEHKHSKMPFQNAHVLKMSAVLMTCVCFRLCMHAYMCVCTWRPLTFPISYSHASIVWVVVSWCSSGVFFECCCELNARGEGSWG